MSPSHDHTRTVRRCGCLQKLALAILVAAAAASPAAAGQPDGPVQALIFRAGNVEDDSARLEILKQLQARPDLDPALKPDVDRMVAFVDRWQHDKSLWSWYQKEISKTTDYDFGIPETSPLAPLASFYRGRMLFWVTNEYGNIIGYHEERRRLLDKAVEEFRKATAAFPDNRVASMYLGQPIPSPRQYPAVEGAPEWAALQRENLERLTDLVEWWIDHRLRPDGQYGGAWDDDCEMWRHWVPVMIAFEHPKITRAQEFFSKALLGQEYMQGGYTRRSYDVEHTAEPTTDTITPMMHLAPDDPQWQDRARRLAELMETLWTGRNDRGQLQFKSTYFSVDKVDPDPRRACDTPYHPVAVPPALLLWLRTGDQKLGALFAAWMDTWVDATARAEHGKPAGVIPAAIHWPDGQCKGPGENWWDPRHHDEPKLYEWPAAMSKMTDTLLLTWHMTASERYLQPLRSMAALRLQWLKDRPKQSPEPGSPMWAAAKMSFLAGTLAKYRLLTGSNEFDELLARDYQALAVDQSDPEHRPVAHALLESTEALRVNFEAFTSEVRFTDRVFAFPRMYGQDMMFTDSIPANNRNPSPPLVYATATGDRGDFAIFPLNAVRWLTPPREIAALVTQSGRDRLTAELFHFGADPRPMSAEFYLLRPGRYTLKLHSAGTPPTPVSPPASVSPPTEFTVTGPRTKVTFQLPPRKLCTLNIAAIP
ncbi:MAG: hypothetical protein ACYC6Y_01355 [Thermoguttaceae bacterium]